VAGAGASASSLSSRRALPTARTARGQAERDRPRLAQPQDHARLGAGRQRTGRRHRGAHRRRRGDQHRVARHGEPPSDGRDSPPRTRGRRRDRSPGSCSPTPATGRTTRSKRSSHTASRSSPPTPTSANNRGRPPRPPLRLRPQSTRNGPGQKLYLKRQGTAEPVFGQIKLNRAAGRFYAAADPPSGRNGAS